MPHDGMLLGHYRLLRSLGNGHVGEVYLAEDVRDSQQVAIKVIHTTNTSVLVEACTSGNEHLEQEASTGIHEESEQAVETISTGMNEIVATPMQKGLLREVEVLAVLEAVARLEHPRIVPVDEYGVEVVEEQRCVYVVMPYLAEGALTGWVKQHMRDGVLTTDEVAALLFQVGEALQYAHERGVLHLDVRLGNVLVEGMTVENMPAVQVADFGLLPLPSQLVATEQRAGAAVAASDQFALAALAYELLTGCTLSTRDEHKGAGSWELSEQRDAVQVMIAPSEVNVELPSALDGVLLRALAERAEERYPSVAEFCLAFDEAVYEQDDLRATLAISAEVAHEGGWRTLMLPGKREARVAIPVGARDQQVIRLKGEGDALWEDGPVGDVIVTLTVMEPHVPRIAVTERPKNFPSQPGISARDYPLFPPLNPPFLHIPSSKMPSHPSVLVATPLEEEVVHLMPVGEQIAESVPVQIELEEQEEQIESSQDEVVVGVEAHPLTYEELDRVSTDDEKGTEQEEQIESSQAESDTVAETSPTVSEESSQADGDGSVSDARMSQGQEAQIEPSRYEEDVDTIEVLGEQRGLVPSGVPMWEITTSEMKVALWEIATSEMKVTSQPLQEPTLLPMRVNSRPLQKPTLLPMRVNSQPLQEPMLLPMRVNSQPLQFKEPSQPLQTPETPTPLPIPPTTEAEGMIPVAPAVLPERFTIPVPVRGKVEATTVVLVLLILVSLASGIFAWVKFQDYSRKQSSEATVTAMAAATATAREKAVAATATVGVKGTAAAASANPYPKYIQGSGVLTMFDALKDNQVGYQWDEQGGCVFKDGTYRASQARSGESTLCFAQFKRFSNFTSEVQMKIMKGACGGIAFRYNEITGEHYLFQVCENGNYSLIHYLDRKGNATGLAGGTHGAIKKGLNQSNTIAVVANGGKYDLYVNGQKVANAADAVTEGGLVGVSAVNFSGMAEAAYSNARLWVTQQ